MEAKLLATSVHDAMAEAKSASEQTAASATETIGARVTPELKATLELICRRNGTSTSAFLRFCAIGLVRDYGAKVEEKP